MPLLKEQQETELERGHELVKVEPPAHHPSNKRPKAGMPGSSVPPEDVHMVQEGDRQASISYSPNLSQSPAVAQSAQVKAHLRLYCLLMGRLLCLLHGMHSAMPDTHAP